MSQLIVSEVSGKWLSPRYCVLNQSFRRLSRGYVRKQTASQMKCWRREIQAINRLFSVEKYGAAIHFLNAKRQYCSNPENTEKKDSKEDKKSSSDNDKESTNSDNSFDPNRLRMLALVAILFPFIYNGFAYANIKKRADQSITWETFVNQYLMQGRVRSVGIERTGLRDEFAHVELFSDSNSQQSGREDKIFVRMDRAGEFTRKLREFEASNNVPRSEQITIYPSNSSNGAESLLFFFLMCVSLGIFMRMNRGKPPVSMMKGPPKNKNITQEKLEKDLKDMIRKTQSEIKKTENGMGGLKKPAKDQKKDSMPDLFDMLGGNKTFKRGDTLLKDKVSFKDVAGLHEAKVEIMEFIDYVRMPEKFQEIGAKTPKGALLLGPPGCGKTLLAKALAGESKVPFYYSAGSEFIKMIGGMGASRIRTLFKQAREEAPCIIFIDEIDAIGKKRSGGGSDSVGSNSEADQTLNQLLAEMDGMKSTQGLIVIAATNRADTLDKALLRPGRFDRHITIDFPTLKDRIELFELYLKKLTLSMPVSSIAPRLAQLTPRMSGADIANICNEAAIHAAREGKKTVQAIDFDYACERVIAGNPKQTNPVPVPERKVIAYHEAGHVLVGWMLEHTDALLKVTIVPRTSATLGFAQYMPKETRLYTKDQLFDLMVQLLGGRAAESVIFNSITSGAQDDLDKVTKLAYSQIKTLGMSQRFGLLSFPSDDERGTKFGPKPYSRLTDRLLDEEARSMVGKAYRHAEKILTDNKQKLHELAATLLKKETLQYVEVEHLLGPSPFGKKSVVDPISFYDEELNEEKAKAKKSAEKSAEKSDEKSAEKSDA
ncbi:paraplegin-like [Mya arenaria]|uniref:paraplegin-like n=1 Tax=Mya arenaria TaxID=6604 RepID=UPI0022E958B9|nr:paraplegin-like [Mya arenaria]